MSPVYHRSTRNGGSRPARGWAHRARPGGRVGRDPGLAPRKNIVMARLILWVVHP